MPKRASSPSSAPRCYGEDAYWIQRHDRARASAEDETDDWLLSWAVLQPLLERYVARSAAVLDLGCGVSPLALDMLRGHLDASGRVTALDIAPGLGTAVLTCQFIAATIVGSLPI